MDGVIEQSYADVLVLELSVAPVVLWRGGAHDVRRWDLQRAVAGRAVGACFLQSVRRGGNLGHCRSETQAVFVLLGYSWCLSGRKKSVPRLIPPIHTPDSYPIHTPTHTLLLPVAAKSLLRSGQY